jgi:hypothetical protein
MANTTFNGPVRSENGFQDISVAESTGVETTNSTFGNNTSKCRCFIYTTSRDNHPQPYCYTSR